MYPGQQVAAEASLLSLNPNILSRPLLLLLSPPLNICCFIYLAKLNPTFSSCSKASFLSDFASLLEELAAYPSEFIALGDFNLHLDDPNDTYATSFLTLLETFDLKQHISVPTHISGHILDPVISKSTSSISSSGVSEFCFSDHSATHCQITTTACSPSPSRIKKTTRKISAINIEHFSADIRASSLFTNPEFTLSSFSQQFESVLSAILDKHAPPKQIICRAHLTRPFITPAILLQKKERSRLEFIFRLDNSGENEALYKSQAAHVHKLVAKSKSNYFKKLINDNTNKPKNYGKPLTPSLIEIFQSLFLLPILHLH